MQKTIELILSDDLASAPANKRLLVYRTSGFGIYTRDEVGNWRAPNGLPRDPPRLWALLPGDPRE